MTYIEKFISSIEVPNTAKVVRHVLEGVDAELESFNSEEMAQFVLSLKPNSPKAIITICYVLGLYARWMQEQGLASRSMDDAIKTLDKKDLWLQAKPDAKRKFISYNQYVQVIRDIDIQEEFNQLYYRTLFQCIYEGIYNDDMSVLKNLRGSDINGCFVLLRDDNGDSYTLEVSAGLAADLRELATKDIWERRNRSGICRVNMRGLFYDSVFKCEVRKTRTASNDSVKFSYYSKLRKIFEEYIGYHVLPYQLYVSGMMHRIKVQLTVQGITVEDAFAEHNRNKIALSIISRELDRCHYAREVGNFREMVKGHIEQF